MAAIIRSVMTEYGASGPGFAIHDPEVEAMSRAYGRPGHAYWVVVRGDRVVGGGGYGALTGAGDGVCELRKMYFLPEARGHGMGKQLLSHLLAQAAALGFRTCYLETLHSMTDAQGLYRQVSELLFGSDVGVDAGGAMAADDEGNPEPPERTRCR